ncbi:hypothetical protein HD806DRAFT_544185 [Xylariaceae sp. AK1471]|nr:hypothetical protein HD806DRAFT_544185 [Xylariaceae sp. AK1471]
MPVDSIEKTEREKSRKRLGVLLTRGRKWEALVKALGWGILFKDSWDLGKTTNCDEQKIKVLRLLEKQMKLILEGDGKTDPQAFRDALENDGVLPQSREPDLDITEEIASVQDLLKSSATGSMLQVKNTELQFNIETLSRLGRTTWYNDELILLCLHLSDRLPNVPIGFSIPIHQQTDSRKRLPRPFQAAAQLIKKWREAASHDPLDAARTEFRGLGFEKLDCLRQLDGSSCGPLVVAFAKKRMMNREVVDTGVVKPKDALKLRKSDLSEIKTA